MTETLLNLVRIGIGHQGDAFEQEVDWEALQNLAAEQGLLAVVLDGLDKLPMSAYAMPISLKKQWIGEVIQGYEYRYELCCRAIAEMAAFYNAHGFRMMVLKGYACSLDWPKPEHRPTGDIDIWQFGQQKEADTVLAKEKGVEIDNSHHHHTIFYWRDFMVENHYDFINVHHHKSHVALERILKVLGRDESYSTDLYGERVYLPSPNLHALFLLKHLLLHFVSGEINLRQVLDWAFFVEKHRSEVDWKWLVEILDQFGMRTMFDIINAICVEDLGFEPVCGVGINDTLVKSRVLNEILCPKTNNERPAALIPRVLWRFRRWKSSEWKHKLCFREGMWSSFWSGVWSHLIKPETL
jgi:hypothetical protein